MEKVKDGVSVAIEKYGKAFIALNVAFMAGVTLSGFVGIPTEIEGIRKSHAADIVILTETVTDRTMEVDARMDKMDEYIDNLQTWVCIQNAQSLGNPPEECVNVGRDDAAGADDD